MLSLVTENKPWDGLWHAGGGGESFHGLPQGRPAQARARVSRPSPGKISLHDTPCGPRPVPQVWQGALLLADWLLAHGDRVRGACCLELGAGTGLAGLVAARSAAAVVLTGTQGYRTGTTDSF